MNCEQTFRYAAMVRNGIIGGGFLTVAYLAAIKWLPDSLGQLFTWW